MERSRLGISINLFAALLYFIGAGGSVLVVAVAAGYVLFFEENERLKKTALKALILIVSLSIITTIIIWLSSSLSSAFGAMSSFNTFISSKINPQNWSINYLYQFLQHIPSGINNIARILEILIPVILGFSAYKEKDIKVKWIDNIIDKHLLHK